MTSTPSNDPPLVVPKYDHLIRPTSSTAASTAATLWQHFGFPANAQKRVLTRKCVICIACSCALRHKAGDEANLRAHLRDAHTELYGDLQTSKRGTMKVHLQTPAATAAPPPIECHHRNEEFLDHNREDAATIEGDYDNADSEVVEFLMPVESPAEEDDRDESALDDEVATESPAVPDADGLATGTPTTTDDIKPIIKRQRLDSDDDHPKHADTTTVAQPTLAAEGLLRQTAEMCAVDLRELDFCDGPGFAKLVMALSGQQSCPGSEAVRAELLRMHAAIHRSAGAASRLQPFALGLEKWFNDDDQRFLTLSLLTDGADNSGPIRRQSLCTWLATDNAQPLDDPWRQAVNALDMQQCQAIILNFDTYKNIYSYCEDVIVDLPSFVENYNLPQVRSLESVLDAAGQVVLSRSAVGNSFERTKDLRWLDDLFGGGDATPAAETNGGGRPQEPHVLACLQTLHTALETVRLESGATAALNLPLCRQLVANHFSEEADDDLTMITMKEAVCDKLNQFLTSNEFLPIATFLDPRFQSFVAADPILLKSTIEKVRNMCPQFDVSGSADQPPTSVTTATTTTTAKTATNGKVGLSFLFGAKKTKPPTPLDAELQRYAAAEALNWEGCPRQWWSQQATALPLLAAAARKTFCVPATLPMPMPSTLERRRGISADMAPTDLDVLMTVNESLASLTE